MEWKRFGGNLIRSMDRNVIISNGDNVMPDPVLVAFGTAIGVAIALTIVTFAIRGKGLNS